MMFLLFSFPLSFPADSEIIDAELMFIPLESLLIFSNRFHLIFGLHLEGGGIRKLEALPYSCNVITS